MDDLDIHAAVARATEAQGRTPGATVPTSRGGQQAAVADTTDGAVTRRYSGSTSTFVELGARGPAQRCAPNDMGWYAQHRAEVMAYRETVQHLGTIPAGGSVTLNPNLVTNFTVIALGDLNIAFDPPEDPVEPDEYAPAPSFIHGMKIWVKRPIGAKVNWTGVKWPVDVTDPDGDAGTPESLIGPATKGEFDSYVIVVVPLFGTFGYLAGRAY